MDIQQLVNQYLTIPPITRYYQTACVITTLLVQLGLLTPFHIYFNGTLILRNGQIWRLFTSFLFFGPFGFNFLLNMIFTFKYCHMLEEISFHNRTSDFVVMCLFGAVCTIIIAFFIHVLFLSQPFTIMLVYIWCRRNPHSVMNFFGMMNFQAPYLPWVLLAFSILLGNSVSADFIGIIVGHSYYYLEDVFPNLRGGFRILKTPNFLKAWFDNLPPEDPNYRSLPEERPGGFEWNN